LTEFTNKFKFDEHQGSGGGLNDEATDYINRVIAAGGTITTEQITAINQLVICLKNDGLWNKIISFKPLIGQVAAAHALNLKDGTTTFDTTWFGGLLNDSQHSYYGTKSAGSSGDYGDEALIPSSDLTLNSATIFAVTRTNQGISDVEIGCVDVSGNELIIESTSTSNLRARIFGGTNGTLNYTKANGNLLGYVCGSRIGLNDFRIYGDSGQIANTVLLENNALPNVAVYSFALNNNGSDFGNMAAEMSVYGISEGLTDQESLNLRDCIVKFLITSNRYIHPDVEDYVVTSGVTEALTILASTKARESLTQAEWDGVRLFNILSPESQAIGAFDVKDPAVKHTYNGTFMYNNDGLELDGSGWMDTGKSTNDLIQGSGDLSIGMYVHQWTNTILTQAIGSVNGGNSDQRFNFRFREDDSQFLYADNGPITVLQYPIGVITGYSDGSNVGIISNDNAADIEPLITPLVSNSVVITIGAQNNNGAISLNCYNTISGYFVTEDLSEVEIINVGKAMEIAQGFLLRSVVNPIVQKYVQDYARTKNIITGREILALDQLYLDLNGTALPLTSDVVPETAGGHNTPNGTDVWSKMIAIYPISPTSEIVARSDFKSLTGFDLQLGVMAGFSDQGLIFTGAQWYDTGIVPSTDTLDNDVSFGVYLKDDLDATFPQLLGVIIAGNDTIALFRNNTSWSFNCYNNSAGQNTQLGAGNGLIIADRRSSIDSELYRFSSSLGSIATSGGLRPNLSLYLAAINNNGTETNFLTNTISFAFIANGLTFANIEDLVSAIERYQKTVIQDGRNVPV